MLWSLNDSGNGPVLFAFTTAGKPVAHLTLAGAEIVDWEDLAIGPDGHGGPTSALYVADIGDNDAVRAGVRIYRVPEPRLGEAAGEVPEELTVTSSERFDLAYPDGPHDAETLLVDPRDGSIAIVTRTAGPATIYTAMLDSTDTTTTLHAAGVVGTSGGITINRTLTGGSVAFDRSGIVCVPT